MTLIDISWIIVFLLFFNTEHPRGQASFSLVEQFPDKTKVCQGETAFHNQSNAEKVLIKMQCHYPSTPEAPFQTNVLVRFDQKKVYFIDLHGKSSEPMPWQESLAEIIQGAFSVTKGVKFGQSALTSPRQDTLVTSTPDQGVLFQAKNLAQQGLTSYVSLNYLERSLSLKFFPQETLPPDSVFEPQL